MPLARSQGFLFIHIPRTGGTSITQSLIKQGVQLEFWGRASVQDQIRFGKEQIWLHHIPARVLSESLGETYWESLFKFSFVRNPWDWVVSTYHYHMQQLESESFRRDWPQIVSSLEKFRSFEEWVMNGVYTSGQAQYVVDSSGELLVDYIAKFESIESDFEVLCDALGLSNTLSATNGSSHGYYKDYYSSRMREEIQQRFEIDIELFGYEF